MTASFFETATGTDDRATGAAPLGVPLGEFLVTAFPTPEPVVDVLFPRLANGMIAGEERLGKTLYAMREALGVALGVEVCGYDVVRSRRVVFIQEEDDPARTQHRLCALLRGMGLGPLDPVVRAPLDQQFMIAVFEGFSLDRPDAVARFVARVRAWAPEIVYIDSVSEVVDAPLGKPEVMRPLVAQLTTLGREHGFVWRLVNHFRRGSGQARARGSQEALGGTQLARWAQSNLFFTPIGRSDQAAIDRQVKDGRANVRFTLTIETDGPEHDPTAYRLTLTTSDTAVTVATDLAVLDALRLHPREPGREHEPGATKKAVAKAANVTGDVARRALDRLIETGKARLAGTGAKQARLYVAIG